MNADDIAREILENPRVSREYEYLAGRIAQAIDDAVSKEREACAQAAERAYSGRFEGDLQRNPYPSRVASKIAAEIRARNTSNNSGGK